MVSKELRQFENIEAWERGRELRNSIRKLTTQIPEEEEDLLKKTLKEDSRIFTGKIAEGFGHYNFKKNLECCREAKGALYKLMDEISIAYDENYIDESEKKEYEEQVGETLSALNKYINFLVIRNKIAE